MAFFGPKMAFFGPNFGSNKPVEANSNVNTRFIALKYKTKHVPASFSYFYKSDFFGKFFKNF